MTLHYYFARRFLYTFGGVFCALLVMLALIDMVEQIRRFDSRSLSFGAIVTLTLLNVPGAVYGILPLTVVLSALTLFVSISKSSEMVIARGAGRSALTTLTAPTCVAFLLGALCVAVLNPIVAATSKQYETLADRYLGTVTSTLSVSQEGLWLRQGSAEGQTVIRAAGANLDGTSLFGVTFLSFTEDGVPTRRIEAASAELRTGAWLVRDAKVWSIKSTGNPEAGATLEPEIELATNLTRDEIADSFGTPSAIPIWDLPAQISRLERAGFSARQYRVWYQRELAMPLFLAAMVLVAAGFTLRPARFGGTGPLVVMALALGFTLYFIRNFAQILGENGQVPVALAAWGPAAAAVLLPLGLLLHLEDG